jgi:uncharacterized protein YqiB (DUF1249 family)
MWQNMIDYSSKTFLIPWPKNQIEFFLHNLLSYYYTRSEIIQIVACDNYDGFPHLNFIFL